MDRIEHGKKYFTSCYNDKSEAIYLGTRFKKGLKTRHVFMVWNPNTQPAERPVIVACKDFNIKEGNKLEMKARLRFPTMNKFEIDYLINLSNKYWK